MKYVEICIHVVEEVQYICDIWGVKIDTLQLYNALLFEMGYIHNTLSFS